MDKFKDPRVLPCQHSYCIDCLKQFIASGTNRVGDGKFLCPHCREEFILPKGGVEQYRKNFLANSLADMIPDTAVQQLGSEQHEGSQQGLHHLEEEYEVERNLKSEYEAKKNLFCGTCNLKV